MGMDRLSLWCGESDSAGPVILCTSAPPRQPLRLGS